MPVPKILLTRRWPEEIERLLADRYDVTLNTEDRPMSAAQLAEAFASYDFVCPTVTDPIGGDIVRAGAGKLKAICNFGAGFSHIDVKACEEAGITLTNTPDVLTEATADIALLLMLMVARRGGEGERQLRAGQWPGWSPTHMLGADVSGRTLGLIGYGRIAQATAKRAAHGFGMKILYNSRRRAAEAVEAETDATYCERLEDLLTQSDFVSLHCPGGAETHHLINAERLAAMKPNAFLINTARGTVIDEQALIVALRERRIGGAGLDVFEKEPSVPAELIALENAVLLPHLGSATLETRTAMGARVVENLEAILAGQEPRDRVV